MRQSLWLILFCGLWACVTACSSADCPDNQNSLPVAGFYAPDGYGEMSPVTLDSISIYGSDAPADTMLLDKERGVSQVYLPFRITQQSTTFVLDYLRDGLKDKITFNYELSPRFVSSECGVVYDYKITSITHTDELIDSVTCPAGVITNTPGENLRIYLR